MSEAVETKNIVCLLTIAPNLREGYSKIPDSQKELHNMEFLESDDKHPFAVECDVLFIGLDDFLIQETEDGRFYSRPCLNNPVKNSTIEKKESQKNLPLCTYGAYFSSLQSAVSATISWIGIDPEKLPRCYDPPLFPSDAK